jgi:hypothetical protein
METGRRTLKTAPAPPHLPPLLPLRLQTEPVQDPTHNEREANAPHNHVYGVGQTG